MAERTYFVLIGKRRKGKPEEVPRKKVSKVVQDYPNKVLAAVTASEHQDLLRQGYKVEDLSSRTKIRVGTLALDPKIPEEREKAVGPADEEAVFDTEYYFIQFVGPVKPKWLEDLKKADLIPISYNHDFSFLVYGKKSDVEKVIKRPYARAAMPYGLHLKLSEKMKKQIADAETEAEGKFLVQLCTASRRVDKTLQEMKAMGAILEGKPIGKGFFVSVLVSMPFSVVYRIRTLTDVFRIESFVPDMDMDEVADQIVAGNGLNPPAPGHHPYLEWLENVRVNGERVTIGIVEYSGRIDENHNAFVGRIIPITAWGRVTHATMVGGQAAGDYRLETDPDGFIYGIGVAPGATLINQNYHDHGDPINPDPVCNDTVSNGGSVQNNSWGTTAAYDNYQARDAVYDRLVRDANGGGTPLAICFAAGNLGWNGLGNPAGAKNIITVGNFENFRRGLFGCGDIDADNINERYIRACADSGTGASSVGSCGDGRVKPDVVAPGQWTASANFGVTGVPNTDYWKRFVSNEIMYGGGTSAASPKVAGACALIQQWWRQRHTVDANEHTLSPALVKAMLINGAVDTGEGGPIPNIEQGWGRIHLNNVFNPEIPAIYVDQEILLQAVSADIEFDIEPNDTTQPLKITLVWTDAPGNDPSGTAATRALKNALGLEVTKGTDTWFGNNFAGGWSQTGGVQDAIQTVHPGDIVNNVQNVFIQNPLGDYHVRISPESINENCLDPTNPLTPPQQQDFALVIQNAKLKATEPLDVMLCIDRTGSMQGTPIAAAKAAAMQFMDLIPTGNNHQAGLVSYATPCSYPYVPPCDPDVAIDDRATVDVDLALVTMALKNNMTDSAGPIASIIANDCTSIGAGLKKAAERIVNNGNPLHRKVIILLTDGKENRSPCVADILPLLRKEYRVHVIAYGHSINEGVVDQIRLGTHAELLHAPNEDQLAEFYHELLALETDLEVVDSETDSFANGDEGTQVKRFPIVTSDSQAIFIVGWKNPDVSLDVELVTPKGETVKSDSAGAHHIGRDTHVIFTLQRPSGHNPDWEGEWSVKIRRASGSATVAETYTTSVLVRSGLCLKIFWDKVTYFTKDLIRLKTKVIDKYNVLKDGVKMIIRTVAPLKGYGAILAETAKKTTSKVTKDAIVGTLAALDRLSEEEWQAIYAQCEEKVETTFEVGGEEARPMTGIFMTPHVANLERHFRPMKDGIYTYRIRVEGHTASGARYTRVRTVSKYVGAKADAKKSTMVLRPVKPQEPKVIRLIFTPRDIYGNLIGSGRADSISVKVEKGELIGKVKDLSDGGYGMNIEAAERSEDVTLSIIMDDFCIPVRVPMRARGRAERKS